MNVSELYFFDKHLNMLSRTTTNHLLLRIVFGSAKSSRQTTPNLIKNPRLTTRGVLTTIPKSYAYNLPEDFPNRHLYWNNTEQNRIRRKQYNQHRLYKLGLISIHDAQGTPLHNRNVEEVLYQLSNLRIVKQSLGRTLINLRQITEHFPEVMKSDDKNIVRWAAQQVHDRSLPSMSFYEFSTYCHLRNSLKMPATRNMLVHLYKWVEAAVEQPNTKINPVFFLKNIKYIFDTAPVDKQNEILYKKVRQFKLFEDVEPENKPLIELLPKLFTDAQLSAIVTSQNFDADNINFLIKIPGGKILHDRIIAAM